MKATSTDTTKVAALYRKAAHLIEGGAWQPVEDDIDEWPTQKFSCWAITAAMGRKKYQFGPEDRTPKEVKDYQYIFKPEEGNWCWGDLWEEHERDDCRVLALCFMAAMVEAGDA